MENEFINYIFALELKKLGFDEECFGYYVNTELDLTWKFSNCSLYRNTHDSTLAPLYQQVFRWFREKYNLNANIYKWQPDFAKSMGHLEWEGSVTHFTEKKVGGSEYFKTYEEAELECLKKLIEIVKNK